MRSRGVRMSALSRKPTILSVLLLSVSVLTGCSLQIRKLTTEATETERAICSEWNKSLPSRSREDTEQTQREIGRAYDVFTAVCGRDVE